MVQVIRSNKIFAIAGVLCVSAQLLIPSIATGEPDALAFGDIRGYFEPCGCDPKTDLGGMARLSGFVNREARSNPGFMILNLGNYLTDAPVDAIKDQHIEMALSSLPQTAVLLNRREFERESNRSKGSGAPHKLPYVLSNWSKPIPGVSSQITAKDWEIYGYLSPELVKDRANLRSVETFMGKLSKRRDKRKRLILFAGSRRELKEIAKSKQFDAIISGRLADDESKEPQLGRLPDPEFMEIIFSTAVFYVPYGGQGALRLGMAVENEGKSVSQILGEGHCAPSLFGQNCQSPNVPVFSKRRISWLSHDYLSSSTIAPIVESFTRERAKEFEERKQLRLKEASNSPFAGASTCKSCHPSSHQIWENSKHASAFAVLLTAGKHRDGECVACHSVGYETGNGFIDESTTPQFSNVQCENCHGPRKEHATNPTVKGPPANLEACKSCHYGQHSPEFDRESFWRKIQHGPG